MQAHATDQKGKNITVVKTHVLPVLPPPLNIRAFDHVRNLTLRKILPFVLRTRKYKGRVWRSRVMDGSLVAM